MSQRAVISQSHWRSPAVSGHSLRFSHSAATVNRSLGSAGVHGQRRASWFPAKIRSAGPPTEWMLFSSMALTYALSLVSAKASGAKRQHERPETGGQQSLQPLREGGDHLLLIPFR
jgi:hypothetical protein